MGDYQQREELLKEISQTGLIPSLKAQMRHSVKERLLSKVPIPKKRSKTEQSELTDNIILEYLFSSGFTSTASVFYSEASINQISRETILNQLNIKDTPGLVAELLLDFPSTPSISTQTENFDLNSRLAAVENEFRLKRSEGRLISSEEMLRRGIEDIEREYEDKFQSELSKRMSLFRSSELMQAATREARNTEMKIQQHKIQLESDLNQRIANLRSQFEKDSEVLKSKQRELEREIGAWAERNISSLKEDSTSSKIRKIKEETTEKAKLLEQKTQVLLNKLEKDRRKLEDIQLEHNKAKREVEKLRSSISIYQQTACV